MSISVDKLITAIYEVCSSAEHLPYNTLKELAVANQKSFILLSRLMGSRLTPRDLGFNKYQFEFFRKLVEAGGKSVSKEDLLSAWGPDERCTENIFHNTLSISRIILRAKGIFVKGWEPRHWRIVEGLPIAQALLAQIDDTWAADNPSGPQKPVDEMLESVAPTVRSVTVEPAESESETPWT